MPVTPKEAARALALEDEALLAECELSFFVGPGPGGQHRNKTSTAVRLVHTPTGLRITATERRSQTQNRAAALERLRELLRKLAYVAPKRIATKPTKGSQRRRLDEKKRQGEKKRNRKDTPE